MTPLALRVTVALLVTPTCLSANPLDRDGDGFSDIWQSQFQAPTLNPLGDPDGDGYPNAEEETAGTDPFDANSFPQIREFIYDESSSEVSFLVDTLKGKQYSILSTDELDTPSPWDTFLPLTTAEKSAAVPLPPGPMPIPYPNLGFFRLRIQDIDADGDGLTAYEECLLGTSDDTPNSSGNPREDDCEVAEDWLETNTPGVHPEGAQDNLSALSLAHLQSDTIGQTSYSLMVTATGSDSWHQLTSWNLSDSNNFTELQSTPPIAGTQPQVHALPHTNAQVGQPLFLTTNIRPDGGLWLSLRSIGLNGQFTHHHTVGYGPQLGLNVYKYAVATRLIYDSSQIPVVQIVTPVAVDITSPGDEAAQWRVLVWHLDLGARTLIGRDDSGDLEGLVRLEQDGQPTSLTASHLGEGSFAFTYNSSLSSPTETRFNLVHSYGRVNQSGNFTFEGRSFMERSLDGTETSVNDLSKSAHAASSLGSNGYLTAHTAEDDEEFILAVHEKRSFYGGASETQRITDQSRDLLPEGHGVYPKAPELHDSSNEIANNNDNFGSVMARGDFNGDGVDDVAIGIPSRSVTRNNTSYANAGRVAIYFGESGGNFSWLGPDQEFDQETYNLPGDAEANDRFGSALAAGDFDNDGYDDLAIGVTGEEGFAGANSEEAGVVQIIYGSSLGLVAFSNQVITQESFGETSAALDLFGFTLAAGDLNGDGLDDLAIGVPFRAVNGADDAGVVYRAWGTESGLNTSASSIIHQDLPGYPETAQAFDRFGFSLAIGDFNGNSPADLAIGIPQEDAGSLTDCGGVQLVYGENSFSGDPGPYLTQAGYDNGGDIPGARESGDQFGYSLAAGDFTGDGRDDLAIGVPFENVGDIVDAGAVNIVYGSPSGLGIGNALLINEATVNPVGPELPGEAEANDQFGLTLAAGDSDGDGYANLMIGIPFQDSSDEDAAGNGGAVILVDGGPSGISTAPSSTQRYDEDPGEDFDRQLGRCLLFADLDGDGNDEPLAGMPGFDRRNSVTESGTVRILFQSDSHKIDYTQHETVRALLLNVGDGSTLFSENLNSNLPYVHIASCTKVMTLLLAVDAINEGIVSFHDPVEFSQDAAETGGSQLDFWTFTSDPENHSAPYPAEWDLIDYFKNDDDENVPFFDEGDSFSLELLLNAMMMESGNRASVAIAEYISEARFGHAYGFLDLMDTRGDDLGMTSTVWGHPAGGCITNPEEMILMMLAGWPDPLFRRLMGTEVFGFGSQLPHLTGTDQQGNAKSNNPFQKITTIGMYPGREVWKGGNGFLWWGLGERPDGRYLPPASRCTSSALAITSRLGLDLGIAVQQTGDRTGDCSRLLNYGYEKTFTPDWRGETEWPVSGGISTGPMPEPVLTSTASLSANRMVTALIDDYGALKLVHWFIDANSGTISPDGAAEKEFALLGSIAPLPDQTIELVNVPSTRAQKDLVSVELKEGEMDLKLWRIAGQ